MSTIAKAMEILGLFSVERPEIGLAEFHRLLKRDKATTYRHLSALVAAGLVEKDESTQRYRIGPAVLRLAHQRETAMPRLAGIRAILPNLAAATGETAHASLLDGRQLFTLASHESNRHSTRVIVENAVLPLHATASGIAVLAFGEASLFDKACRSLKPFTRHTVTDPADLRRKVEDARQSGFAVAHDSFEAGVHGTAVPLFDVTGRAAGALAVASMSSRMTEQLDRTIRAELVHAGRKLTESWGGSIPHGLDMAWTGAARRVA